MKACARAPVRVDPAGGGTDAPPYCIEHGGAVVNFAVERHVYASAQKLPPGSGVIIYSADLRVGATAGRVSEFAGQKDLEFLKAFVLRMVPEVDSLLLLTESDVPRDSGLGGSGAVGVAVVAAIDGAYGRSRSPAEIAALANEIERSDLGYPGGNQDSYAAALGDVNLLQYHRGGGLTPRRLQLSSRDAKNSRTPFALDLHGRCACVWIDSPRHQTIVSGRRTNRLCRLFGRCIRKRNRWPWRWRRAI